MTRDTPVIPRILHQTWRTRSLPPDFARFRAGWVARHPAWTHRIYDDDDCRREVASMGSPWPAIYERLPTPIQRADLFRYLVVHRDGGVYADVDMECYRPLDPLLQAATCVLAVEAHLTHRRRRRLGYREPRQIANCVFAAAPGHAFLERVLAGIARGTPDTIPTDDEVEDATGPRLLTRVFEGLNADERARIRVVPQVLLVPPTMPGVLARWVAPYARHHFAGTWKRDPLARRAWWRRWRERDRVPPFWPAGSFERKECGG